MKLDPTNLTVHHLDDFQIVLKEDEFLGYAAIDETGICRAFGAVFIENDGRAWAMVDGSVPMPWWGPLYAARVFSILDELGLEVFATCDKSIRGAEDLMVFLGFEPIPGKVEWKREPGAKRGRRLQGGRGANVGAPPRSENAAA